MKKYIIQASQINYYEIEIEAESAAQAIQWISDGDVSLNDPIDTSDFTIGFVDVEELTA
jgi:hypothetical protein